METVVTHRRVLFVSDRKASRTLHLQVPGIRSSIEFDVDGRPLGYDFDAAVLSRVTLVRGIPRIFRLMPALDAPRERAAYDLNLP